MLASLALTLTSLAVAHAQLTPNNLVAASTSGTLSGLKYTSVGGTGSYYQVTNMLPGVFPSCTIADSCQKTLVTTSGPLAPFDNQLTFNFRGPMNLFNIAVYQPTNTTGSTWKKISSWAQNETPDNMVFMNNMGGGASGEWSICGGSSQSYASGDWTAAVASPNAELYPGNLASGKEINIMTATPCTADTCEGFFRGTANEGWAGSKMIVIDYNMPEDPSALPAIWTLDAQVVRSAQYGCNCRGEGSGSTICAEMDIAETLTPNSPNAFSEIYSFKGATGTGDNNFFPRPTGGRATLTAIYDVKTDTITALRLTSFDYTQTQLTRSMIDAYINSPAMVIPFGTSKRSPARSFNHRRHH
ncbi:putative TOS1-like glycosyl hydrolase-domain-containing protein [Cytidiella melzeri]|nr:putative TOS1-like glycosyl hydrolase-domain-containing protein [Cytidiella melzeri]